ncbi:azurin [Halomonas piscis]|uniref:Azurin n=1 Tax=Halomonas piscis TaxID=3031727 RepID=A0ABY9YYK9_9GAMM|nr:azurin [Halomonas piscis]WNK19159.1 azurin [Halomonas piscis]
MKTSWMLIPAAAIAAMAFASPTMAADECELTIEGDDQMQFNKDEMSVPASCDEVTVTLKHTGEMDVSAMGHNWVLSDSDVYEDVAKDGMGKGLENDYLPEDDERVIAHTEVVGGGEETSVTFSTEGLEDRDLTFFCSFPGHYASMNGSFTVTKED